MSESIQSSLPPRQPASDTVVDQLMRRVQSLEEERVRWRRLALIGFFLIAVGFVGGLAILGGAGTMYWSYVRGENERERALQEAQMRADEQARQAEMARAEAEARFRVQERLRAAEADELAARRAALEEARQEALRRAKENKEAKD